MIGRSAGKIVVQTQSKTGNPRQAIGTGRQRGNRDMIPIARKLPIRRQRAAAKRRTIQRLMREKNILRPIKTIVLQVVWDNSWSSALYLMKPRASTAGRVRTILKRLSTMLFPSPIKSQAIGFLKSVVARAKPRRALRGEAFQSWQLTLDQRCFEAPARAWRASAMLSS